MSEHKFINNVNYLIQHFDVDVIAACIVAFVKDDSVEFVERKRVWHDLRFESSGGHDNDIESPFVDLECEKTTCYFNALLKDVMLLIDATQYLN